MMWMFQATYKLLLCILQILLTQVSSTTWNTSHESRQDSTLVRKNERCFQISQTGKHFIHSRYFYSASLSPLLLGGAPDTARILCRSFMPKHHRQLRVKDLPKVPMWRPESGIRTHIPLDERRRVYKMNHHAPLKNIIN